MTTPMRAVTRTGLDNDQDNAYYILTQMLQEWGLASLSPEVLRLLQEGYSQQQIGFLLQDTEAYRQRFYGNELRRQKGLAVLSPAEYLQIERSYRQIMYNAGLPSGFYDSPDDFSQWVGLDVSPVEVQRRVDEALDATTRIDQATRNLFQQWYGLSPNDLTAFVLDPVRGRDELNKVLRGTRLAGAAAGAGVRITRAQAQRFGAMAGERYLEQAGRFAEFAAAGERLSGFYGGAGYRAEEAAQEVFGASTEAERRRRRLFGLEEAEFAGAGGATRGALTPSAGTQY